MIERLIANDIHIACPPEQVYDYVTQPWRWHEWHPSSVSAHAEVAVLREGDWFDEQIILHPVSPLPLALRRETRYRVQVARRASEFQVSGEARDGSLTIRYQLAACEGGTHFQRQLCYQVSGALQLVEPLLLYPRIRRLSAVALSNLKGKLEQAYAA